MKSISTLSLLLFFFTLSSIRAQSPFTATDIDGATHDVQAYLDQGKPVLIMVFTENWGFYWSIHEGGAHTDLYNTLGQGGTEEIVILYIAGDGFDSEAEIYDVDYSADLGPGYESVDITAGHSIPVIVAADNPDVDFSPKGERIWMCPYDDIAYTYDAYDNAEQMLEELNDQCCTPFEGEDPGISWAGSTIFNPGCDPTGLAYSLINNTATDLEQVAVDVYLNGGLLEGLLYEETIEGCAQVTLDYNNPAIQEGDEVTMVINQANTNLQNDTVSIVRDMVDTVGTTVKFELIDGLDGSILYFNALGQGSFLEVSASGNWTNYLFLEPGCYDLSVGAFANPSATQFALIGTVDDSDQYTDTLFYGSVEGEEFFVNFTINAIGEAAAQKVWGYVFEDADELGAFNPSQDRIAGIQVNYGSLTTFTDAEGYYEFPEWIPSEQVGIVYDEAVWPVYTTPGAGSVGSDSFIANFGLNSDEPVYSLAINLNMGLPYICESTINSDMYFANVGNQPTSAELVFVHDPLLEPVSFYPVPDLINGDELTYLLEDIQYGGGFNLSIGYQEVSANLLGELLTASYTLNTFDDQGNVVQVQTESQTDTLFCAYDPNDKYGFPLGSGEEGIIEADTPMKYRIRFQNTGNLPATTVVIRDTLPDELDWDSFAPFSSTHNYSLLLDENSREVVWTFNNIMLPDSASDPEGSIGSLWFDIEMNALEIGDQIENTAYIFFDANEPIITNTSLHTIGEPLSTGTEEKQAFSVYPNPAEEVIFLKGDFDQNAVVSITDLRGRLVMQAPLSQNSVDVSNLETGVYLVSVEGMASVKLVVGTTRD